MTSWTEDRKEEDTQPVGLLAGLQDQVNDLEDRGQEGGRQTASSWSYSSELQDQVSDLVDGGQEGGGQTAFRSSYRASGSGQ